MTTAASRELVRLLPAELPVDWDAIHKLVNEWSITYGNSDPTLTALAVEVAEAYVANQLPFLVANAVVGQLMVCRDWRAPTDLWEVFIAFEDLEIEEEPGPKGSAHVAAALERVRTGSTGTRTRRPRATGTPGSSDA